MSDHPTVMIAASAPFKVFEMDSAFCASVASPCRILLPKDCVAEIFNCPEGTEIRIRFLGEESLPLIPPDGKKKDLIPTSTHSRRIAAMFGRRLTTEWSEKEIKTFKKLVKRKAITDESLDLMEAYYAKERTKGDNGRHRRDLCTFLNNFDGELDRATAMSANGSNGHNGNGHKPPVRVSL